MLNLEITRDVKLTKEEVSIFKKKNLQDLILKILKGEKIDISKNIYISLYITNDEKIQQINKEYRGKDMPTDVISFAYQESEEVSNQIILGDIVLSIDRVRNQSIIYNNTLKRESMYLLCHSVLHLLGYDHIKDEDKKIMRKKEEEYLRG